MIGSLTPQLAGDKLVTPGSQDHRVKVTPQVDVKCKVPLSLFDGTTQLCDRAS